MEMIELLEQDKEQLEQSLARCTSPDAAKDILEQELDRMLLRYNEECGEEALRTSAAAITRTARTSLQMIDTVGEIRVWDRRGADSSSRVPVKITLPVILCLIAGAVLTIGSVAGAGITSGTDTVGLWLRSLPAAVLGGVLLILAGYFAGSGFGGFRKGTGGAGQGSGVYSLQAGGRTPSGAVAAGKDAQVEIRVDAGRVMNCMRAAAMVMDRNLEEARQSLLYERSRQSGADEDNGGMERGESDLLSQILELSYGQLAEDPAADAPAEVISTVKYYLHRKQIDVVDYSDAGRGWFEMLPGSTGMTLRPALVKDGVLIRKGLASMS